MKRPFKKAVLLLSLTFSITVPALQAQEYSIKNVTAEATKKESLEESLRYLKEQIKAEAEPAKKRALYMFTAALQEQMCLYSEAHKNYAQAARIPASEVEGVQKKSNEQLVLDAARCALSSGDWETADTYLNSNVRNSKNADIQAHIKLYTQWSVLCAADKVEDLQEPVLMLQTYSKLDNMKSVRPAVLLTLWYITGNKDYSKQIADSYPSSVEAAIVNGDVQLLPTPFWFFVPKQGEAETGTGTYSQGTEPVNAPSEQKAGTKAAESGKQEEASKASESKTAKTAAAVAGKTAAENEKSEQKSETKADPDKTVKLQLGLFKTESNAKLLAKEVTDKGFKAYVTSQTRASGTTYYLVLVNETENGVTAEKLRNAGYDCYIVE